MRFDQADNPVRILGADGNPMAPAKPTRASMLVGGSRTPYDAADNSGDYTRDWNPYLWSPDGELNMYRDRIVSRVRDLARNDGWASGAVTRVLDNAVGANFRPILKPDFQALAAYTGNPGFDADWAGAYAKAIEAYYRGWAHDPGRYCDAQRALTIPQIQRVAFRHKIVDGDALAILPWLDERIGLGCARYATAVQLIDPDRLSNPQLRFDSDALRGGVEVDGHGAATGYWIRRAHQGDWFSAADSVHWDRIARETAWGRPVTVHDFEHDRANQHRGGAGILTPVVQRLKMLVKYDVAELDASILNAVFGAYIESPFDGEMVKEAMGDSEGELQLNGYQGARSEFHQENRLTIGGARMPILFPGEKINAVTATRPNSNFAAFEKAVLRNVASAAGLSAQQVSNDWSDVNYSSARGAMLEFWKTMTRRRDDFAAGFSQPILRAFVEELHEVEDLPLPPGAPAFEECAAAYCRAQWIGPGRGWVDPEAEIRGAILGMDAALVDFDAVCAEQGVDPDDMIAARAKTIKRFRDQGLEPPTWAGINPGATPAEKTIVQPKAT